MDSWKRKVAWNERSFMPAELSEWQLGATQARAVHFDGVLLRQLLDQTVAIDLLELSIWLALIWLA